MADEKKNDDKQASKRDAPPKERRLPPPPPDLRDINWSSIEKLRQEGGYPKKGK